MKVELALNLTKKELMDILKKAPYYGGEKDFNYYKNIFKRIGEVINESN